MYLCKCLSCNGTRCTITCLGFKIKILGSTPDSGLKSQDLRLNWLCPTSANKYCLCIQSLISMELKPCDNSSVITWITITDLHDIGANFFHWWRRWDVAESSGNSLEKVDLVERSYFFQTGKFGFEESFNLTINKTLNVINSLHRQVEMKRIRETDVGEGPKAPRITAILSYSKGFACALGSGTVCLFEKKEEDSYRRSKEIRVNYNTTNNINLFI